MTEDQEAAAQWWRLPRHERAVAPTPDMIARGYERVTRHHNLIVAIAEADLSPETKADILQTLANELDRRSEDWEAFDDAMARLNAIVEAQRL